VQTLSGTGALRLGAEFLQQHHPVKVLYLPSPSWGNHEALFREAHLEVRYYRYWHQGCKGLDEEVGGARLLPNACLLPAARGLIFLICRLSDACCVMQ
jgi:aspartate/tyrosine/aromatic aminotransferase